MKLTWKDALATVVTAVIGFIAWVSVRGWDVAVIDNHRLAILAMGALGLGICAFASSPDAITKKGNYSVLMSALGGMAFLAVIAGLISGGHVFLWGMAGITLVLWAVTTVRHATVRA